MTIRRWWRRRKPNHPRIHQGFDSPETKAALGEFVGVGDAFGGVHHWRSLRPGVRYWGYRGFLEDPDLLDDPTIAHGVRLLFAPYVYLDPAIAAYRSHVGAGRDRARIN